MRYLFLILITLLSTQVIAQTIEWDMNLSISNIKGVSINVKPQSRRADFRFKFNQNSGYVISYKGSPDTKEIILVFSHPDYETLEVECSRVAESKRVWLGKKGTRYIRRGNMDMPYIVNKKKAGVFIDEVMDDFIVKKTLSADGYQFEEIQIADVGSLTVLSRHDGKDLTKEDYIYFDESSYISVSGPLLKGSNDSYSVLTNQVTIQFSNSVSVKDNESFFKENELEEVYKYTFARSLATYLVKNVYGTDILDWAKKNRKHPAVEGMDLEIYECIGHRNSAHRNRSEPPIQVVEGADAKMIAVSRAYLSHHGNNTDEKFQTLIDSLELIPADPGFANHNEPEMVIGGPGETYFYFKRKDGKSFKRFGSEIILALRQSKWVNAAGCFTESESIYQNQLIVNFHSRDKEAAIALLDKHGFKMTGGSIGSGYIIVEADLFIGVGIIDKQIIFQNSGLFTYVQQNGYTRIWYD